MMKRLTEQTDSRDPSLARAAKLVESAQPLAPSDAMRRRVLASVVREHPPFAARSRWIGRSAAVGVVLLATTAAAASFHEGWLPQAYRIVFQGVRAPFTSAASLDVRSSASGAASLGEEVRAARRDTDLESRVEALQWVSGAIAAELATGLRGEAEAIAEDARSNESHAPAARRKRAPQPHKTAATPLWDDGAKIVLSAIEILRRQHDAARAGQLLDEYLRVHPQGALCEEAMALAAEAASARGDLRESRRLASQYERTFPDGRFRQALQKAALPSSQ